MLCPLLMSSVALWPYIFPCQKSSLILLGYFIKINTSIAFIIWLPIMYYKKKRRYKTSAFSPYYLLSQKPFNRFLDPICAKSKCFLQIFWRSNLAERFIYTDTLDRDSCTVFCDYFCYG